VQTSVHEEPFQLAAREGARRGVSRMVLDALLDACKAVERALGREAGGVRHGPRPVDVDVLLLGTKAYESERLSIPHREVARRRFVLAPLLELDPRLELPDGTSLAAALGRLEGQDVRRAGPPLEIGA
jgi:7,8-dihydro-6-hydroxymethylpterin-pyrophosphokinase